MNILQKVILGLLIVSSTIACKREENTPTAPAMDKIDPTAVQVSRGNFSGQSGEVVSGAASIRVKGSKYMLILEEDFRTNNGPNLHVYLSKAASPQDFIDFGLLKSVSGTQVYDITGTPDFKQYKYALIYCQQYSKLFGNVLLQ